MEDPTLSSSPPRSPVAPPVLQSEGGEEQKPKKTRKKRKSEDEGGKLKARKKKDKEGGKERRKEKSKTKHYAQQMAVQDQMRRVLEEDRYSAVGSVVSDSDSEPEADRMERSDVRAAMRKRLWMMERRRSGSIVAPASREPEDTVVDPAAEGSASSASAAVAPSSRSSGVRKKKRKKSKHAKEQDGGAAGVSSAATSDNDAASADRSSVTSDSDDNDVFEDGSIFGPTTGSSHATWVECDKCKKWRRLRGVVDETKLPSRWYCSMNKNDPERNRCSAPEEEYSETAKPEENAVDARTRKHLRVWVRRLRCQEAFRDARRPMTRGGNKRSSSGASKEPYDWIRCSSCGKWRACLRFMDKSQVLDRHSEWYCVMNTWDEKMASCAAPQENLPAIGCPPWVMQDEN